MASQEDEKAPIDHLIELRGVYDGWSICVRTDGTMENRWSNDEGTGPAPGYERRWRATEKALIEILDPASKQPFPPAQPGVTHA